MKKVLLISAGIVHPPLKGRKRLRKTLEALPGFEFRQVPSMDKIPEDLDDFCALVIYFHHKKISQEALETFDTFVTEGGGVLAVHSVTASFKERQHFTDILGGKFTGHGPVVKVRSRRSASRYSPTRSRRSIQDTAPGQGLNVY